MSTEERLLNRTEDSFSHYQCGQIVKERCYRCGLRFEGDGALLCDSCYIVALEKRLEQHGDKVFIEAAKLRRQRRGFRC